MTTLMEFAPETETTSAPTDQRIDRPAPRPGFEIRLGDGSTERVLGATAYLQEGQMTTFFRTAEGDPVVDAWSERVASIRTAEIIVIRKPDPGSTATASATEPAAGPGAVHDAARAA